MTEKSAAFVPLILTLGVPVRLRFPMPRFSIVKVWSTVPVMISALPKSVPSAVAGVVSPSTMLTPFPLTLISPGGVTICFKEP